MRDTERTLRIGRLNAKQALLQERGCRHRAVLRTWGLIKRLGHAREDVKRAGELHLEPKTKKKARSYAPAIRYNQYMECQAPCHFSCIIPD